MESQAWARYLNAMLDGVGACKHLLPIGGGSDDLFDALRDGVLFCCLINHAKPDTVDMRSVKTGVGKPLSVYHVTENLNLAISSAGAIGKSLPRLPHAVPPH